MQVNAVNSLITQTPSFSSRSYDDANEYYNDVNTILTDALGYDKADLHTQANNGTTPEEIDVLVLEKEKPSKKNALETAIAVSGAVLIPFITGKAIVLGANKIFPNVVEKITANASKITGIIADDANKFIESDKLAKLPKAKKCAETAREGVKFAYQKLSKSGKPVETMANVAGIAAAATAVPNIISSDSNHDGIKDIAQKSVSAYGNITRNLGTIKTIVDVMV
jgi:hypothetical protein